MKGLLGYVSTALKFRGSFARLFQNRAVKTPTSKLVTAGVPVVIIMVLDILNINRNQYNEVPT